MSSKVRVTFDDLIRRPHHHGGRAHRVKRQQFIAKDTARVERYLRAQVEDEEELAPARGVVEEEEVACE